MTTSRHPSAAQRVAAGDLTPIARRVTWRARARGATTVEYALLVAIVVALGVGAWRFLGHRIQCALGFASAQLSADGRGLCARGGPPGAAPSGPIAAP